MRNLIVLLLLTIAILGVSAAWNILPEPPRIQVIAYSPEQIKHEFDLQSAVQQARQVYLRNHVTTEYTQDTAEIAVEHHVAPAVVAAVVVYESHANPKLCARDCGLMQINRDVWHYSKKELLNPHRNIQIGTSILAEYVRRFGLIEGLHHYNGLGPKDCPTDRMAYAGKVDEVECQLKFKGCLGSPAMYGRRKQYAQVGPWLDCCENCARVPYEQPKQFQEASKES